MVYSDVIKAGLILPKKGFYTMKDVNKVLVDSLFGERTLTESEAAFIVRASAVHHDTLYSEAVSKIN